MIPNYLYMFEFVVDDLIITKMNKCAPKEYPLCVDFTFRSSVFVSVCDEEIQKGCDSQMKSGKCCLFALEAPVNAKDRLMIQVFKKHSDKCKFLIGMAEMPVKDLFDIVTAKYNNEKRSFGIKSAEATTHLPRNSVGHSLQSMGSLHLNRNRNTISSIVESSKADNLIGKPLSRTSSSSSDKSEDESKLPVSELVKTLLPMSNLKGKPTGSIIIILRLSCMGQTIVSPFPVGGQQYSSEIVENVRDALKDCISKRPFHDDACDELLKGSESCESEEINCEDKNIGNHNGENCDEPISQLYPCLMEPSKKDQHLEYDEYEANLNYNSMIIRLLKDSHKVKEVIDDMDSSDEICKCCACGSCSDTTSLDKTKKTICKDPCHDLLHGLKNEPFVRNVIKKNTGGRIRNGPGLPLIRGNVKYPGNLPCGTDFTLPLADEDPKNVEKYRKLPPSVRACCMQVTDEDIDGTMRGVAKTFPKGVEICRKSTNDPETDVFLLKLGKKKRDKDKQNLVEIELKTPKAPVEERRNKMSRETQIQDSLLDITKGKSLDDKKDEKPVAKSKKKVKKGKK